ncbi:MAG TPA: PAS domain S-box protein [Variovorax sp.]|nr:PAS domain S-box protein [Variovorax sp.]
MPARHHLQQVIESAIDFAIVVTDLEGRVTDWNRGAWNIFGWRAEEMVGASVERLFTAEDRARDRPREEMRLATVQGRASDERWHVRRDDSRFWASGELMPLRDEAGTHRGYVKILRDRTRQHEDGRQLREFQDRFRTLLETVETAFAIVEVKFDETDRAVDYRFIEANPAFERQAGVNLRGKWVTEFAPDLERFWFDTYGHVAWTGEPANFESYAKAFQRWFDVRAIRVGEPAERQIAIFFNDVTERRTAQDRLSASEAIARENAERVQLALAAGAIIGTWHWDLPTDCFTVDEAFATAFGLDPELGRTGLSLEEVVATVHPDDKPGLAAAIDEAVRRGGAYAHQYRVRRVDGRYYWIEANGRVDHAEDGTPLRFPGVLLDVQERRALQEERDRNAAALRALNETLEQRVVERTTELMRAEEQLRQSQKMEAVGQLTGGLAHDFNNLLAGISGSLELMKVRARQGRFDDLDRYIQVAQGATRRAAGLTHRLLAFSRRQTLTPKPTNVNQLISGMEELVRRTIGPAITLEVVGSAGLWPALIDPGQLENALLNLCINARDAMPDGGRIAIETANVALDAAAAAAHDLPEGPYLSLCVTDTGTGMPPDVVARVFEPFFTTKPIGEGTGLGLSMIHGFAQQSGGQVSIQSEVGRGTRVWLYMPRHHGEADGDDATPAPTDAARAREGQTVLVVDDEPSVRMLVGEVLEDLGYVALEAEDSAAGLKLLQSGARIDLLVTDVGLPGGMNGRQMADAARVRRPDLKVLFITGYAETSVLGGGRLEPGMHVLTKPFPIETLGATIKALIDAGPAPGAGPR